MNNYFAMFELATAVDIDLAQLRNTYRTLQTKYHPDKFAAGSDQEKRQAVETAATLNDAYQTLINPVERAKHIYALRTGAAPQEQNLAAEPAFLMMQIEAREKLEEFKAGNENQDDFYAFIDQYEQALDDELVNFDTALNANEQNKAEATIAKMQLYRKLLSEAQEIEEGLE